MKIIKCFIPILLSILWIYFLQKPIIVGDNAIPPLGKFMSPFTGFWQNVRATKSIQNTVLNQMPKEGSILFDDRMVPHIFAQSTGDAYFMQGYVHAMHRLWQMDFSTRAAEGRISEIIGSKALNFDKNKRRKGLAESAKQSIEVWKKFPEAYKLVEAYCDGVNYYIQHLDYKDLPIEYKLMNFEPELWTPYRSSLFHKNMAEVLCGRDQDIEMTNAKTFFGADFDLLFPEYDPLSDPVIPKGTKWDFNVDSLINHIENSNQDLGFIPIQRTIQDPGLGSNNWAVGPSKSVSGNPILCNDPHLNLSLPSIWYEQQIVTPDRNVYGVTFPGIPGVIIGFNKDIAWGITNGGWDVMDWYQIKWKDESMTSYFYNNEWKNTEYRIERIKVRGEQDVLDTVPLTVWGPVVYNQISHAKYGLAMHWIIQDPSAYCEMDVFDLLNQGKNVGDYRNAIQKFPYPAQNFAFISKTGDIALTVQGKMPIKVNQQGRFVMDGTKKENAWHGFVPLSSTPHTINPIRGFVSSANQKSTDRGFPVYYNDGDFRDYRGTMINRYLSEKKLWNVDDMKALQYNAYSLRAETALPSLLKYLDTTSMNSVNQQVYHELKSWNYMYDSNAVAPVYFDLWMDIFHRLVWDEISQDTLKKYTAMPSDQTTIRLMKENINLSYYDIKSSPTKESLQDVVRISYDSLLNQIQSKLLFQKKWADYKHASIDHMARIPAFGIPFVSTSGSKDIINAHARTFGPSWRMIVELTEDGPKAFGIYPGGQDGRPGNVYYQNMVLDWSQGKYNSLKYAYTINDLAPQLVYEFKK
ncbi:MAG: penicillin acylase family protein [Saprospiraceae bacterium]|nr:penicillin acylase family protein [Candidatus Defluviibacterium haderslevense]